MAKKRYRHITIHPSQGGALIGSASDDVPIADEKNFLTSSANYTEKINFRREVDGELRREGWNLFNPSGSDDALGSQYPIRGLHQFTGTDGTPVLIAVAGPEVYRLSTGDKRFAIDFAVDQLNVNPIEEYATVDGLDAPENLPNDPDYFENEADDFIWKLIYTFPSHMDAKESDGTMKDPFEGGAYRWEFAEIQNHLVINNGIDLPIVYKSEYELAHPVYGLRENGVSSVGTISNFQDRLFCGDLIMISSGFEEWFGIDDPYSSITAHSLYAQGTVQTQRYQYRMIYSAEGDPKLFNTGIESGLSVIAESGGLPGTLTVGTDGTYKMSYTYNFNTSSPASMYQEYTYGIHSGVDHMGIFLDSLGSIKFDNEDFEFARKTEAIKSLGVKFPTRYSPEDGDNQGFTESEILQEMLSMITTSGIFFKHEGNKTIRFVDKDEQDIVLLDPTSGEELIAGDYPMVLRPMAEQIRKPAAFQEFIQDGTRILKMKELADKLVVYRDSGFFFLTRSNSTIQPYAVDPRYTGGRNADFRNTVIQVSGNQHLFMGNTGVYSINRSSTEPKPVETFELGPPFWQIVPPELAEFVYTIDNPVTREIFINCPLGYRKNSQGDFVDNFDQPIPLNSDGSLSRQPILDWGVIAYDYINGTLSQIDASFTACATIRRPKSNRVGPEQMWFIMGVHQAGTNDDLYVGSQWREDPKFGGVIVRYGYGPPMYGETEPYRIYNRLGYGYTSTIRSGLIDFGNSFSDKEVRSYVLELSSKYGVTPIRVRISTSSAPQGTEVIETMSVVGGVAEDFVTLNQMRDENMIPLYLRAPYLRDEISVLPDYEDGTGFYVDNGYVEIKTATNVDGNQTESYYLEQSDLKVIDNPVKLVGRTFEVSGVDTRATTQTIGQG
jgi:hypothetical protein